MLGKGADGKVLVGTLFGRFLVLDVFANAKLALQTIKKSDNKK